MSEFSHHSNSICCIWIHFWVCFLLQAFPFRLNYYYFWLLTDKWTHLASSCVLSESNWANNWQRRSSLSSRMPQRSTPTTHPPMGSSISSRKTLPETKCIFFLLIVTCFSLVTPTQSTCNNSAFYARLFTIAKKIFCILLRRQWKRTFTSGIWSSKMSL